MLKIDKVIRIEIPAVNFEDEFSMDLTEWWTDYNDLQERKQTLKYLKMYYKEELQALKDGDIDYISLYYDIF